MPSYAAQCKNDGEREAELIQVNIELVHDCPGSAARHTPGDVPLECFLVSQPASYFSFLPTIYTVSRALLLSAGEPVVGGKSRADIADTQPERGI